MITDVRLLDTRDRGLTSNRFEWECGSLSVCALAVARAGSLSFGDTVWLGSSEHAELLESIALASAYMRQPSRMLAVQMRARLACVPGRVMIPRMLRLVEGELKSNDIRALVGRVRERAQAGDRSGAWVAARPLLRVQRDHPEAAGALLTLIADHFFLPHAREALAEILDAHPASASIAVLAGEAYERLRGAGPAQEPSCDELSVQIAERLLDLGSRPASHYQEQAINSALASLARMMGTRWDNIAECAYRRNIQIEPHWRAYCDLGRFLKQRGRFAEGLKAFQRAAQLGGGDDPGLLCNIGTCATGTADGDVALAAWKALGLRIDKGRFGLPDAPHAIIKVLVPARRPPTSPAGSVRVTSHHHELAWVERISPCHGIVRSALYSLSSADYGDVVLFDTVPLAQVRRHGDDAVPVFPHLGTIVRAHYDRYPFAATQERVGQVAALGVELVGDALLDVRCEQTAKLQRVVTGKLCVAPDVDAQTLLATLDHAVRSSPGARLYIPQLVRAAGDSKRAELERLRYEMLSRNVRSA